MISAGPAGKTYVYELSKIGFKALDLGHYKLKGKLFELMDIF